MPGLINAPPPARTYPNINAVHGIRAHFKAGGPGKPMVAGKSFAIGTLPRGAVVMGSVVGVSTGFLAAGFTLDVGTLANATAYAAGVVLDAAGQFVQADTVAGLGYTPEDTPVYATLRGTGSPTAGEADVLITFYTAKD